MARTTAKKAKPKKAAPKKAMKKAAAKKTPAKKSAAKAVRKAPAPEHHLSAAHRAELQARVGRPRKGEQHQEQVQPIANESFVPPPPVDHLHGNYGDAKARSVARQDNPTNWFRQAPKPKSK